MNTKTHLVAGLSAIALIAMAGGVAAAAPVTITGIATSGEQAGDTGQTFTNFNNPYLNEAGQTAFIAQTTPDADGNNGGIFRGDGTTVAFDGQAAGDTGETFTVFRAMDFNDSGEITFLATTTDNLSSNDQGSFRQDGSTIAFQGQLAGNPGERILAPANPILNDQGDIAYSVLTSRAFPNFGSGIFLGDGTTVVLGDDPAGDTGEFLLGNGIVSFGSPLQLNNAGQIAFGGLTTPDAGGNDSGYFFADGTTIAFEGRAAGDTGETFQSFEAIDLNEAGQVVFGANTTPDADGDNSGIFMADGTTVAFEGRAAGSSGETYTFFFDPDLNNQGEVVFRAFTTPDADGNNSGLFLGDGTTIAFEGDAAQGTGQTFTNFSDPTLNNIGQVVFTAGTTPDVDGNRSGLFVFDPMDGIRNLVFQGDVLTDSLGIARTVLAISFDPDGVSDNGVAFRALYAGGGSGLFFAPLTSEIPLPAAGWAFLAGLGLMRTVRGRRSTS
ncbi:MAG: VPLPA-CTERM sorting domain-containing protein [Pseudomonadota bacterium]